MTFYLSVGFIVLVTKTASGVMPTEIDITEIDFEVLLRPNQFGAGIETKFIGVHGQRGYGLSGIFQTLANAMPYFLSSPIGQAMFEGGQNIVRDVFAGENVKKTLSKHGRNVFRNLTGLGRKRKSPIGVVIRHKRKRNDTVRSPKVSLLS